MRVTAADKDQLALHLLPGRSWSAGVLLLCGASRSMASPRDDTFCHDEQASSVAVPSRLRELHEMVPTQFGDAMFPAVSDVSRLLFLCLALCASAPDEIEQLASPMTKLICLSRRMRRSTTVRDRVRLRVSLQLLRCIGMCQRLSQRRQSKSGPKFRGEASMTF